MSFDKQHVMGAAAGLRSRVGELDQIRKQGSDNTVMLEVHLVALAYFVEANVETICAALEASSRQEERLRLALSRVDKFIENYRAPWGSWKTAWWEGEVSDDAAFSDDNAMMHIANIVRPALEPPHAKDAADV